MGLSLGQNANKSVRVLSPGDLGKRGMGWWRGGWIDGCWSTVYKKWSGSEGSCRFDSRARSKTHARHKRGSSITPNNCSGGRVGLGEDWLSDGGAIVLNDKFHFMFRGPYSRIGPVLLYYTLFEASDMLVDDVDL